MKTIERKTTDIDFRINFLSLGVAKSGSTWLADKLRLHPQIYIPNEKTIYYFNQFREKSSKPNLKHKRPFQWYHSFFKNSTPKQITGEIAPEYFIQENCAKDIFNYNPNIKLLVTLRNPIQRAYSQYIFRQQIGRSNYPSFEAAIRDFPFLLGTSLYFKHLKRYFDIFPRESIKVMFYDDLRNNIREYYREVLSFLGVKEYYPVGLEIKTNVTMEVRSKLLGKLMTSIDLYLKHRPNLQYVRDSMHHLGLHKIAKAISRANKKSILVKSQLGDDLEYRLREFFLEDINNLEELLKKDLSHWK